MNKKKIWLALSAATFLSFAACKSNNTGTADDTMQMTDTTNATQMQPESGTTAPAGGTNDTTQMTDTGVR